MARGQCQAKTVNGIFSLDLCAQYALRNKQDNQREMESLVARMAGGEEHALACLYDSTNRIVYGLALRILGEPSSAEDVTMEVYLQVWRTAGSYDRDRGTVLSWLATSGPQPGHRQLPQP